jgi:hypothetical protein
MCLEFLGIGVLKLLIGNSFYLQGQFDLDLCPLDPKINIGHLLVMNNHHTKFEVPKPMLFSYHSEIILPPMSM